MPNLREPPPSLFLLIQTQNYCARGRATKVGIALRQIHEDNQKQNKKMSKKVLLSYFIVYANIMWRGLCNALFIDLMNSKLFRRPFVNSTQFMTDRDTISTFLSVPSATTQGDQVSTLEDAFEDIPSANKLLLSWLFKHLSHLAEKVTCVSIIIMMMKVHHNCQIM